MCIRDSLKRYPLSQPYDRSVNPVKANTRNMKRGCELDAASDEAASTSKQQQCLNIHSKRYTINNIYPVDVREELLSKDEGINQAEHYTQCPTVIQTTVKLKCWWTQVVNSQF